MHYETLQDYLSLHIIYGKTTLLPNQPPVSRVFFDRGGVLLPGQKKRPQKDLELPPEFHTMIGLCLLAICYGIAMVLL
jgi:hypothetical protein